MRTLQNNLIVLVGMAVVMTTAIIRSLNPDPSLLWLGNLGILTFALCTVGQIITSNARINELYQEVDTLRERMRKVK